MSAFHDAIADVGTHLKRLPVRPKIGALANAIEGLPAATNSIEVKSEDLADLQRRLANRVDGVGVAGLSIREFRDLPYGFWHGPVPLDRHGGLFASFLERLSTQRLDSVMRRFVAAFLDRYPRSEPSFRSAATFIGTELTVFRTQFTPLKSAWNAFDPEQGPDGLAEAVLQSGLNILTDAGLPEHLWTGAFVERLFQIACKRAKPGNPTHFANLKIWAQHPKASLGEALRFPRSRNHLMRALLGPWRGKAPEPKLKAEIIALIDRIAGDPRTSTTGWIGVDEDLRKVYLQWLAEASLKQFMDIVEKGLRGDANALRMWRRRRAYWTAWFRTGLVDQAWVAFGPGAHEEARRASARDPAFGRAYALVERPKVSQQSALLMRIGDHTVVEWSHSGKCWIWPNSRNAPKLDRKVYEADDLREAPIFVIHHDTSWQHGVTEELRRLTGFLLPQHTWVGRGE